jgi:hypothetical protein
MCDAGAEADGVRREDDAQDKHDALRKTAETPVVQPKLLKLRQDQLDSEHVAHVAHH